MDERPESPASTPADRAAVRARQRRQIRSGCGGCLVVIVALALFLGGFAALKAWLNGPALGNRDAVFILIGTPEKHASAIVWIGAFTLVLAVAALAVRSMVRAIVQAVIVLLAGAATLGYVCCGNFEALRLPHKDVVELAFLWPRPAVRCAPTEAVISVESEVTQVADTPTSVDYLVVEIAGKRYRSAASGSVDEARRLLLSRGARVKR